MAAVALVQAALLAVSPFSAITLQEVPPFNESSRLKKSPLASSPLSRWPWKYQTDRSEASYLADFIPEKICLFRYDLFITPKRVAPSGPVICDAIVKTVSMEKHYVYKIEFCLDGVV